MNTDKLFKVYVTNVWQEAKDGRITWDQCSDILMHLYEAMTITDVAEKDSRRMWTAAMKAWDLGMKQKEDRTQFLLEMARRYIFGVENNDD